MKITYPSFMSDRRHNTQSIISWAPIVTGDWGKDTAQGKVYADEAMAHIRIKENPSILGHVMKSMIGQAAWSGVEVGFFHRISEHLLAHRCGEFGAEGSILLEAPAIAANRET